MRRSALHLPETQRREAKNKTLCQYMYGAGGREERDDCYPFIGAPCRRPVAEKFFPEFDATGKESTCVYEGSEALREKGYARRALAYLR